MDKLQQLTTKDKVIALRVSIPMLEKLEQLAEEKGLGSPGTAIRELLNLYLIPQVYEQEWKQVHSENFESYLEELEQAGKRVSFEKYKKLIEQVKQYQELLNVFTGGIENSIEFLNEELNKFKQAVELLEKMQFIEEVGFELEKELEP